MKRVAFVLNVQGQGWLGGVSYYRNLLGALMSLHDREIEPVVLTAPNAHAVASARAVCSIAPLGTPLVDPARMTWKARRALQRYWSRDVLFEKFARQHDIVLLSHSGQLGRSAMVATLPWIPDFQELHYPEFFSPEDKDARARNAEEVGRNATAILLSSEAAREDIRRIDPVLPAKCEILRFVADVLPVRDTPDVRPILAKHGIDRPFFLLPNQFWVHKNHVVIIEAMRILKKRGFEPVMVATGNTADHRQPGHFGKLMDRVRALGVEKEFRAIGTVTYHELMSLMRGAIALVNPSLFEGWSTTVEEAKSLGKAILLSDIPVHREQNPARARYFVASSAEEAAEALFAEWKAWDADYDRAEQVTADAHLSDRRLAFARDYQDIALRTIAKANA
jgi:glycosyltransferase involved in cell wall biosynthesis